MDAYPNSCAFLPSYELSVIQGTINLIALVPELGSLYLTINYLSYKLSSCNDKRIVICM